MKRHVRENYYVVGEGILSYDDKKKPTCHPPSDEADIRKFRFSRLSSPTKGPGHPAPFLLALGNAMTVMAGNPDSTGIPAGFTYLGQFVDHDLTQDKTARSLGSAVTVDELLQGRSPALDLDSLYGRGPTNAEDAIFYSDGARLVMGRTKAEPLTPGTNMDLDGFDLPRVGLGSTKVERRRARIPDLRNDENLAVAQIHLAFMRFHNAVVDRLATSGVPSTLLFEEARKLVVKHYQWMLLTDYLPRVVDPAIVDDVFTNGRQFFEKAPLPGDRPTMPIEFSVAAFRLGHSMIRESYNWNRLFHQTGVADGTLGFLFQFSGTSGILSIDGTMGDPESGSFERLPTNWIADFRRLFDFTPIDPTLQAPEGSPNPTKAIDTRLVDVLAALPAGSFGARGANPPPSLDEHNLAFRNLVRANMVELATGQQMAQLFGVLALTPDQILDGNGGVVLRCAAGIDEAMLTTASPLWFYILREAEFSGGKLGQVGGRIVAEVFHRAMEGSDHSIVREPAWRPDFATRGADTFEMIDLLWFASKQNPAVLAPLG